MQQQIALQCDISTVLLFGKRHLNFLELFYIETSLFLTLLLLSFFFPTSTFAFEAFVKALSFLVTIHCHFHLGVFLMASSSFSNFSYEITLY